ncbi:putative copper-binding protein PcoE [Klebsiella pneumoniae]|nr:putative copper-binding protein PcoE [Klebsiella pneumoniae]
MTHEMMQNGNASAHQDMAEMHKNDEIKPAASNETAKSFSEMNEHEKPLLYTRRRIMVSLQ